MKSNNIELIFANNLGNQYSKDISSRQPQIQKRKCFLMMLIGERTFSNLKLIKSLLRNSITQEGLPALSIISIDSGILGKIYDMKYKL